jgi:Flp pilus assembly pilin Flp
MLILTLDSAQAALRSILHRLRRDQRGVAAIEFGFIAPIMFLLFVGSIEISQAVTVDRRVTQIASSTADLVAREKTITTAQLDNIMSIAKVLMSPYDTAPLRITLVSVGAKSDNASITKVCWSYPFQGGTHVYADKQAYSLPPGIIDKGGSVVVAEVEYDYTPLIFHYFITSMMKLNDKFYLKPRVSSMIQYNASPICTIT